MTDSIKPIFLDLDIEKCQPMPVTPSAQHHNKACTCSGKCRICRCAEKKSIKDRAEKSEKM
jgi:hypothetical protein